MLSILLFASLASGPSDTIPFSAGELGIRGGTLLPLGSLSRLFDPAAQVGLSLSMSHWGTIVSRLDLDYAHLDGEDAMHTLHGAAGFDWRPFPLEIGASLALFYVKVEPKPGAVRLSDGGETEFGCDLRAALPIWRAGPWTARLEARWEEAFTAPRASAFVWGGLSLTRRAW